MTLNDKVKKGVRWTSVSTIVLAASSILKVSILARFLNKSDFGLMAIIVFILGFMELFNDMGITSAILHKQNISKYQYSSLYWFNLSISFFLYLVLLAVTPLIVNFYEQPLLQVLIPLSGLNLLFSGLGRQFRVVEQKKLLFKEVSIIEIFSALISLIIAVILAFKEYGVFSLVYSAILQQFISNLLFLITGLRKQKLLIYIRFSDIKDFLKIGLYQTGGQILNFLNRDLDILLIGKFFSADILGGYSLAKQLVFRPAQIINPILTKVAAPALALFQNNKELLKKNYFKLVGLVSTINILVYCAIILFANLAVRVLYGDGFDEIVILVRLLSVYMMFRAIGNPIGSLVIATGRTDLEFYWNVFSILVMPIFVFIGIQYEIVDVAISLTLGMLFLFIPSWWFLVRKMTGAGLKEYLIALNPILILNQIIKNIKPN